MIRPSVLPAAAFLSLAACFGEGSGDAALPDDKAPRFAGPVSFRVAEGDATRRFQVEASSPAGGQVAYALTGGGADADAFRITPDGSLRFAELTDFEHPADADGDNVYEVIVAASAEGEAAWQVVTVEVTDGPDTLLAARGWLATGASGEADVQGDGDGDGVPDLLGWTFRFADDGNGPPGYPLGVTLTSGRALAEVPVSAAATIPDLTQRLFIDSRNGLWLEDLDGDGRSEFAVPSTTDILIVSGAAFAAEDELISLNGEDVIAPLLSRGLSAKMPVGSGYAGPQRIGDLDRDGLAEIALDRRPRRPSDAEPLEEATLVIYGDALRDAYRARLGGAPLASEVSPGARTVLLDCPAEETARATCDAPVSALGGSVIGGDADDLYVYDDTLAEPGRLLDGDVVAAARGGVLDLSRFSPGRDGIELTGAYPRVFRAPKTTLTLGSVASEDLLMEGPDDEALILSGTELRLEPDGSIELGGVPPRGAAVITPFRPLGSLSDLDGDGLDEVVLLDENDDPASPNLDASELVIVSGALVRDAPNRRLDLGDRAPREGVLRIETLARRFRWTAAQTWQDIDGDGAAEVTASTTDVGAFAPGNATPGIPGTTYVFSGAWLAQAFAENRGFITLSDER